MEPPEQHLALRLPDYLASLEGISEDGRRIQFPDLLQDFFGVDLAHAQADAEAQLSRYITGLHRQHPGRSFTTLAVLLP